MRLLSEQVSNIRLWPRPERNIGVKQLSAASTLIGGVDMRKLLIPIFLCICASTAASAQSGLSNSSAEASVTYYIPGLGEAMFDPGTTFDQAIENVCQDPEVTTKFPSVACDQLLAGIAKTDEDAADSAGDDTKISMGATTPSLVEQRNRDATGQATLGGGFIALIIALGSYVSAGGRSASTQRRKWPAIMLAVGVFCGTVGVLSDLLLWGHVKDAAVNKFVGWFFLTPVITLCGHLYGKRQDRLNSHSVVVSPAEHVAPREGPAGDHFRHESRPQSLPPKDAFRRPKTTETLGESTTDPYIIAGQELLSGDVDAGLWARALVEGDGVDGIAKAAYIRLRLNQLSQIDSRQDSRPEEVPKADDSFSPADVNAHALRQRGFHIEKRGDRWDVRDPRDGALVFMRSEAFVSYARVRLRELKA